MNQESLHNTNKRFIHPDDISRKELMEAYDRLKGKAKRLKRIKENGFVVACPNCQNQDLGEITFVQGLVELRSIARVENGTVTVGDSYGHDQMGDRHFQCNLCSQDFAIPTKAKAEIEYD